MPAMWAAPSSAVSEAAPPSPAAYARKTSAPVSSRWGQKHAGFRDCLARHRVPYSPCLRRASGPEDGDIPNADAVPFDRRGDGPKPPDCAEVHPLSSSLRQSAGTCVADHAIKHVHKNTDSLFPGIARSHDVQVSTSKLPTSRIVPY